MSLRFITDIDGHTALYDTVSETAFGPVFTDPQYADAFLDWTEKHGVKDGDVRQLHPDDLREMADHYFELGGER